MISEDIKYYLSSVFILPLLPLLYFQGKRLRKEIPTLPEATRPTGHVSGDGETKRVLRLLAIGESTIAGVGVGSHADAFTGIVSKELSKELNVNIEWNVYAKSGYTVRNIRQEVLPKIQENKVDLLFLGVGANDAFQLNSPGRWIKDIRECIRILQEDHPNAIIVCLNLPPIKEFPAFSPLMKFITGNLIKWYEQALWRQTQNINKVYFLYKPIRIREWLEKRPNSQLQYADFFSDGLHPSQLTHELWAKEICRRLLEQKEYKERVESVTANRT